jgi:hypothetical protein
VEIITKRGIITQRGDHHKMWKSSQNVEIITKCGDHTQRGNHHKMWRSSQSVEIITKCGDHHNVWRSSQSVEIITKCGEHHNVWRSSQCVEIIALFVWPTDNSEFALVIHGRYHENGRRIWSIRTRDTTDGGCCGAGCRGGVRECGRKAVT